MSRRCAVGKSLQDDDVERSSEQDKGLRSGARHDVQLRREKRRCNRFPGILKYELTPAGRSLLSVLEVLGDWLAGQLEARPGNGKGTPTPTAAVRRIDAETAFLLAVPPLRLPADLSGSCRMAAEFANGEERCLAGVRIEAEGGAVVSCVTRPESRTDSWALGSPADWLDAVIVSFFVSFSRSGELLHISRFCLRSRLSSWVPVAVATTAAVTPAPPQQQR